MARRHLLQRLRGLVQRERPDLRDLDLLSLEHPRELSSGSVATIPMTLIASISLAVGVGAADRRHGYAIGT